MARDYQIPDNEADRLERERYLEQVEADYQEEMRKLETKWAAEDERYQIRRDKRRAKLSPAQREKEKEITQFIVDGLKSGAFTAADIVEELKRRQSPK